MSDYQKTFETWRQALNGTEYEAEIVALANDPEKCSDSFYRDMEFGTAGMRGIIGIGSNRMNVYTVRRATQALANLVNEQGESHRGVAIAYDTRKNSDLFAKETAGVLLANGIHVYMYDIPHSVPQLSFAVLELNCAAGVVITASHNPPQYNGYKVYGEDGGQMAVADSNKVTAYIEDIKDIFTIESMPVFESEFFHYIGKELDSVYYKKVESIVINKDIVKEQADTLNIVYTPLHGTGLAPVRQVLTDLGIKKLYIVPEQEIPDPSFPTVSAPNPENREAFDLAMTLADKVDANLILATDPDCDRLGLAVRCAGGGFEILTGNQIGCLLLDYLLSQKRAQLKDGDFVVKSIVSTDMATVIARHYGVGMRNVYTGFKFIAEQIKQSEQSEKGRFLFGFEESYGYLFGAFVRDKDAVQAATMAAEMASHYAAQGKTLYEAQEALYEKYGWYNEKVLSHTLYGQEGIAKILGAVEHLRAEHPSKIGNTKICAVRDYQKQIRTDLTTGDTQNIPMESMNMLFFELEYGSFIVRPSGTEPKLKTYLTVHAKNREEAEKLLDALVKDATGMLERLLK